MTLIVALASPSVAAVVADRRVSHSGAVLNDEYNKLTVFFCEDAKLATAFTGTAVIGKEPTSDWICRTLFEIGETFPDCETVIEQLRTRLNLVFADLNQQESRLTIVMTGFVYWTNLPEPRIYSLTNWENGSHTPGSFRLYRQGGPDAVLVETFGDTRDFPAATRTSLEHLVRSKVPTSSLIRFAVVHLRKAAEKGKVAARIGEQCNAALLLSAPDTPVVSTYHTAKNSFRAFAANVVVYRGFLAQGMEITAQKNIAGKDLRKKEPCWCGSGSTFGRCHLRKYGAISATHPAWRTPLALSVSCVRDESVPTGRVFWVQSSYV